MKKSVDSLIKDEHKAVRNYGDSEKGAHPKAKKVFKHIIPEEREHAKELNEVKRKIAKRMK